MGGARINGKDYLTAITSGTEGILRNKIIYTTVIEPGSIPGRLATFANCYEKYRFTKLSIHWKPNCAVNVEGGLIGCFEIDSEDNFQEGNNLPREIMSVEKSRNWRMFDPQVLHLRTRLKGNPFRYVDATLDDPRWEQQAKFVIATTTPIAANIEMGELWVSYSIEFQGAHLEQGSNLGDNLGLEMIGSGVPTTTHPYGADAFLAETTNMKAEIVDYNGSQAIFLKDMRPGTYFVLHKILGTGLSTYIDGVDTPSGWTITPYINYDVSTQQHGVSKLVVGSEDKSEGYLWTSINALTTISGSKLYITPLPRGMTKTNKHFKKAEKSMLNDVDFLHELKERLLSIDGDNNNYPKMRAKQLARYSTHPTYGESIPDSPEIESGAQTPNSKVVTQMTKRR